MCMEAPEPGGQRIGQTLARAVEEGRGGLGCLSLIVVGVLALLLIVGMQG